MFSVSTKRAKAIAAIFSLIETSKANHLDPRNYIEYLLEALSNADFISHSEKLVDFLP